MKDQKITFPLYIYTKFNSGYPNTYYKVVDEKTAIMVMEYSITVYDDLEAVRLVVEGLNKGSYHLTDKDTFAVGYAAALTKINSLINPIPEKP